MLHLFYILMQNDDEMTVIKKIFSKDKNNVKVPQHIYTGSLLLIQVVSCVTGHTGR